MVYVFIVLYLLVIPISTLFMLWKALDTTENIKETQEEIMKMLNNRNDIQPIQLQRKHSNIGQADYDNAFGGRKAYSIYKNTNGLYEPVTPSKGITIKKKEE